MIEIERLLRVPHIDPEGSFDISPDGTRIAFAWNVTGRWEIYEMDLNASDEPRLVSAGVGGKFAPRYSPDGSRLAYVVDFDGGENFHLFVHNRNTGRHHDLTPTIDFAIQRNFCWSPDGSQIAFLANRSGCFSTYAMPASGGDARLLLDNGFPAWLVTWSPDGRHLAVMSETRGQDYNIFIIPLDSKDPFPITDANEPLNAHNPAWSADGAKLAFQSDARKGFHQIAIYDLDTRNVSWLTDGLTDCRFPTWSKDGLRLAYTRAQGTADQIVIHSLGGETKTFQVENGVHSRLRFTPDGKCVALAFSSPRHPPDLWVFALEFGELRQLTNSLRSSDFSRLRAT